MKFASTSNLPPLINLQVAVITPDSDSISELYFRQPRFDSGQDLFFAWTDVSRSWGVVAVQLDKSFFFQQKICQSTTVSQLRKIGEAHDQ
jgi:hypothetical protein